MMTVNDYTNSKQYVIILRDNLVNTAFKLAFLFHADLEATTIRNIQPT